MNTYEVLYNSLKEHHEAQMKIYEDYVEILISERDYWMNRVFKEIDRCGASQRSYLESSQAAQLSTMTSQEQ